MYAKSRWEIELNTFVIMYVYAQVFRVYNAYCAEGFKFDIEALTAGPLDDCLALVNGADARVTLPTIVFVTMVTILPHCDETWALESDISFSNVLHGILFHYLVVHFFVYGCESGFVTRTGLFTSSSTDKPGSECEAVKKKSLAKLEELTAAAEARGLSVPDLESYFFKHRDEPLILNGDRLLVRPSTGGSEAAESIFAEPDSQVD